MNTGPKPFAARRTHTRSWIQGIHAAVVITSLGAMLLPTTAWGHPQTREGFFIGLGLAKGSAGFDFGSGSSDREGGSGGSFRFGWAVNPKFGLGLENNSWFTANDVAVGAIGVTTVAASFFPAEGLVLRGGLGAGYEGAAGEGLAGDAGFGWTIGTAYEFRVARSFAIGPQIDYTHVDLSSASANFYNIGLSMNWYFIPK